MRKVVQDIMRVCILFCFVGFGDWTNGQRCKLFGVSGLLGFQETLGESGCQGSPGNSSTPKKQQQDNSYHAPLVTRARKALC